jgi:hypothetical protein
MKTLLLALLVLAAPPENVLLTVHGKLTAASAKAPLDAQFYLAPQQAHTAVELQKDGTFVVKAVAAREYTIDITASGYAKVRRTAEVDARGVADLGNVQLEPLRKARVSAAVGPRAALKDAPTQTVEVRDETCANVRAQDDSGCLLQFCTNQEGDELKAWSQSGALVPLGKLTLADALKKQPAGGTFVTGRGGHAVLRPGEVFRLDAHDAYCGAVLRVDEVNLTGD